MKNFYLNLKLLLAIAFSAFIQQTHAQYPDYVYVDKEFCTTNSDGVELRYRICQGYNQYSFYLYAELIECDKNYSGNVNIPNGVEYRVVLGLDGTTGEEVYLSEYFSVESIGSKAFNNCKYISSIYVPNTVDHINFSAFVGCSNISLNIEEGNNEIEFSEANSNPQIEHIFLGRDIKNYNYELDYDDIETKVFYSPFANLTSLKSITFSKKINKIPTLAFKNCSSLNSIIIHENINEIGSCAFVGCKNLNMTISDNNKYYYTEDKILFNKNKTKILGAWKEGTYSIPNSVTSIGSSAFEGCSGLSSINIPNSVTSIGSSAFEGCSGLSSINIPNSVTSIGGSAFKGCSGLSSITIPNSVTYIYAATFRNCSKLTNLTIEDGVKTLYFANPYSIVDNCYFVSDGRVFENSPIENLYIGRDINYESYDFIGDLLSGAPFSYSKNLKSVTIGEKVTKIHDYFFIGCDKISSLIIPKNVTSIGKYAFYGNKLQSITVAKDNANYSSNEGILFNKNKTALIQYPCGKQGAYTIPDNVTTIEEYAFYGSSGLSSITIPNSVTNIKEYAFYGCSGPSSITIPNSVTNIKEYAFYNCSGLTHLTIGNSVEEIAYCAFGGCNKIKEIYILNPTPPTCDNAFYSVNKSIPIYVLSNNYGTKWGNFTNITNLIPITFTALNQDNKELTYSIPTYEKFENKEADFTAGTNTYRGSIVIPTNVMYNNKYYTVKTIANGAFKSCSTLTSVILPKQTEEIEEEAFSGCNRLKEIYFPNSTKRIGIAAFEECTGLEEIIIGTNLESIGEFAFVGCTGLKEIYSLSIIPANCDTDAFLDVDTSIPIYIPVGTKAAYQSAPEWKNFTNFIESDFTDIKDNKVSTYNIKTIVGNGIAINDYYGKLRIVSLSGQVVKEMTVNGYAQIDLPKGAYIIVTNNNSQKVIL